MRANASAARTPARSPSAAGLVVQLARRTRRAVGVARRRRRRSPSSSATGSGARAARRSCGRRAVDPSRRGRPAPGSKQQQRRRAGAARAPARGRSADRARRRCRRRDEQPRVAVVGMEPVRLPRIVPEHDVGPHLADHRGTPRRAWPTSLSSSPSTRRRKRTSTAPRISAASRCSSSRVATSAARSASASQVPFEPSVQMHRCTSAPASAHFASVAPQPNSMSSGCAPTASTRRGHGEVDADGHGVGVVARGASSASRSAATSTSKPSAWSRTIRTVEAAPRAPRRRGARTSRARTRTRSRRALGSDEHRVAVVAMIGNDHGDRRVAVVGDPVERRWRAGGRRASRRAAASPRSRTHSRPASAARVERSRIVDDGRRRARAPTRSTSGALDTIDDRASAGRGDDALGHRARERAARVVVERVREPRLAQRERPQRDDDACVWERRRADMACVCYRPWTRCTPWRRACSRPGCGGACTGRSRARTTSRRTGPVILASNHVSYLDPLTLAWVADRRGRHVRFLAKAELFDKPALGPLLRGRAPDPGAAGPRRRRRRARRPRSTRSARGECVAVFPEGTISRISSRWSASRAPRGSRSAPASPITPVGLWGTHRILTKGRKPHWQWGIAQTAVVGEPIVLGPDEHVKRDDRSDHGRDRRVRRAGPRDLPARRRRATTRGGGAIPRPRARTGGPRDARRGRRRGVVGDGGGRDRGRQRADHAVGAARRARGAASTPSTRTPTTSPGIALPAELHATAALAAACAGADVVVFAVPSHGLRAVLADARPLIAPGAAIVSLAKGIEQGTLRRMTEVIARGARRSRPEPHRRAHRTEPRARGRGRSADRVGRRDARRGGRRRAAAACSSRRRCACTRTPTSSAARWPARSRTCSRSAPASPTASATATTRRPR